MGWKAFEPALSRAEEMEAHAIWHTLSGTSCPPFSTRSWGVESEAIRIPASTGSIHWPRFNLADLFLPAK